RVLAAVANRIHLARAAGISGQLPGHELQIGEDFVVVVGNGGGRGEHTPLTVRVQDKSFEVGVGGSVYRIQLQSSLRDLVVRGAEKLAVIEAMKMENILLATQDCVVGEVVATKGESLAVDQVIITFA